MNTEIVKINPEDIPLKQIKKAAFLLDSGGLVGFATETVYGIGCRVKTGPLTRLNSLKGRTPDKYYTLHISEKSEVSKYVPSINLRAEKLINNAWPGPLTIVFELNNAEIDEQQKKLDSEIFENLYKNNTIGIRCPDDPVASMLLSRTEFPIVAPSANLNSCPPAINGEQVADYFAGKIDFLLDSGRCKYKKSSTVVKVDKKKLEILREGVYPATALGAMSKITFLFVCTGNTCRSPMAEAFLTKYLTQKLDCNIDQLDEIGYKVLSAGTMGINGVPPSKEVATICESKGISVENYESTGLTTQLLEESDFIFAMSQGHIDQIRSLNREAAKRCLLLAEKGIPDPIGQSQQVYNICAETIEKAIQKRIGGLII